MSRWTEPGLEPEERAHAAVWHVRQNYQTTSVNEAIDIVTAAIRAAVEEATAKEREACAELADEIASSLTYGYSDAATGATKTADAIRARRISGEGETR